MNGEVDQGDFLGGIQSLGLMNALKTGDVRMDILIAMCIPIFIRFAFSMLERAQRGMQVGEWQKWWHGRTNKYQRYLVTKSSRDSWGEVTSLDSDTQNAVLIKAVQLYIHHNCKLHLQSADLDLTSVGNKNLMQQDRDRYWDDEDEDRGKTMVGMLSKYSVIKKPPHNEWHKLGNYPGIHDPDGFQFPVQLRIEESNQQIGKDNTGNLNTTSFRFVSPGPTSIDTFIDRAYTWYMSELKSLEDNSRYLYEMSQDSDSSSSRGRNYSNHDSPIHVRYKLSDEKTFESLFFQQKQSLLNLVGHFTRKTGKYAIMGYPHKLGLLLHGPPGTGKTSLIKALAQHTGRSIVNVPLAKISTNSELMDIFFSKKYHIKGEDVPVELGFKDVIFVMEDVDACSRIVRRRDGKKTADITHTEQVDFLPPKSIWRMLLESNEDDCKELVELLMTKSDRLKEEALKPEVLRGMAQRIMVLPGLGLVGQGDDALQKIGNDALESASELMEGYSTVDRFVSTHAKSIKALLDAGAKVDDDFVDDLLGNNNVPPTLEEEGDDGVKVPPPLPPGSFASIPKPTTSRELSYTKYSDEEIHLASVIPETAAVSTAVATSMQRDPGAVNATAMTGDDFPTTKASSGADAAVVVGPKKESSLWSSVVGRDKLNLTGLLNVLDGVVDTPGRILIMTTNHPEMLDPALIRPGRIDKKLMLGYMAATDVVDMLQHYFQTTLDVSQKRRVENAICGNAAQHRPQLRLTPAQVEQFTAEHDELEDMICALEAKGGMSSIAPKMPIGTSSVSSIRFDM